MTINGILYLKNGFRSQNRSPKWRFFGNLRVQILNTVIGTPKKALRCPERRHLTYFA